MKYNSFVFKSYDFDFSNKTLVLKYCIDNQINFAETYTFGFDFIENIDEEALDRAVQVLFFVAGVSYYKTYLPPTIIIEAGQIDGQLASFLNKTYQKGLGEFFYVNNLDPQTPVIFPTTVSELSTLPTSSNLEGLLIGIGGGKDSLVSTEILRTQPKVTTWSLDHREQLAPLIERIDLPHLWVERQWDPKLLELKSDPSAYNGHIPISAIIAGVGAVVSILSGQRDHVVSNESSTSEPTLSYQGVPINHQYSKSLEFEQDFQKLLAHMFNDGPRYYSFLRPLSEIHITEVFARVGFDKYHDVFSSCNKAYVHDSHSMSWCSKCPKCAFVFLAFTPFMERERLEVIFGGKNLLLDPELEPTYRQLLGIKGDKPLECVGEIKENRSAMRQAQNIYPQLSKYNFDIPEDYNYKKLGPHSMPEELFQLLQTVLS